ncbi:MAG: hypothetical protein QG573_2487 [Acidobacteriota bacterium]|nr:hypothetical protein [Acidobacteriota bacterium]
MSRHRRYLVSALLMLGPQAVAAQPRWSPPESLDDVREVYEISSSQFVSEGSLLFAPALFGGAPNALEVLAIDFTVTPPVVTPDPVATGNIFALGALDENPTGSGFSFVDGSFDLRYGFCPHPCTNFTSQLVAAGTLVDSASGASASHHFVATLGNSSPRTLGVFHSANGSDWTLLYSYVPPETGGVCGQYNGCGRIGFVVDPTATVLANTLSCLTFEVTMSATTTERRVTCFLGNTPQFVLPVDTDVPYAAPVLDRLTDGIIIREFQAFLARISGVYRHRETEALRAFELAVATQALTGPVELGPAPAGSAPFGLSGVPLPGLGIRILWAASGPGEPANDVEWDPATLAQLRRLAPSNNLRQLGLQIHDDANSPGGLFVRALFSVPPLRESAPLGAGLMLSSYRLPLFDDGFETADTLRWSATSP